MTDIPEHVYADLGAIAGLWVDVPGFDEAIKAQDQIEECDLSAGDVRFDHLPQIPRL